MIFWDDLSNFIVESDDNKSKNNIVDVIRNYHIYNIAKDKQKNENNISKIYYYDIIKHLLVIENETKKILIYNYLTGGLITSFSAHNGSVLAAENLTGQDLICTSGSDNFLLFLDQYTIIV